MAEIKNAAENKNVGENKVDKKFSSNTSFQHIIPDQAKTNYLETFMHLFKGNIGVGLFAMGDAFKNGGIYVAPSMTIIMAIICVHCQHLLLTCTDIASLLAYGYENPVDYAEAVALCFAEGPPKIAKLSNTMGTLCNYFIAVTQLGFCCIYLTFIATNINQILDIQGIKIDLHLTILIIWIPIWVFCMITQLKTLAAVSLIANLFIVLSFLFVIYFAVKDGLPPLDTFPPYTDIRKFMLSFGTIIFSYEGIALLLPIKNAMTNPNDFSKTFGVLNMGMVLVVLLYMTSGFCGYMKWGDDVMGTMTANIGDSIFAQCTKVLVSVAIMLTYPLQFFVPMSTMLPGVLSRFLCIKNTLICELVFRTLVTFATLLIAELFPKVGIFISLIGGLCSTVLALVFPPVMECLLLKHTTKNRAIVVIKVTKNCFILLIAFISFTVGTFVSIGEIVKYFQNEFTFFSLI